MGKRQEYSLDLSDFDRQSSSMIPDHIRLRPVQPEDTDALGELMIEAYRGTIDYDGEKVEDSIGEIQAHLAGERGGRPLLEELRLVFAGSLLVGACLAGEWQERQAPIIAYVKNHGQWKNHGVGRQVLWTVLDALWEKGHPEVRAVITKGNTASERLFDRIGFRKVNIP